ncbi:MAG: hypothetical protein Q9216_001210 [Gyalolechia sp. 2 TL-2023]
MSAKRVLLLGGHGKVSLLLTPLLASKSWHVTSVVRDPSQKEDILAAVKYCPEMVDVLVSSLEDVKSTDDAKKVIDQVKPDYVVWSADVPGLNLGAGSGGKGGPSRTQAIDRDSCIHFIQAARGSIAKFLLVSYLGSRRNKAPWWTDQEWVESQEVNTGVLKQYYPSKLAADESLTAAVHWSKGALQGIVLRPGRLTDDEGKGKVSLGKTRARGSISRSDVAAVAAQLLNIEYSGWIDLLEGDEPIADAVRRVCEDEVNCVEGEDFNRMVKDGP